MRILITGGAGFIGTALSQRLLSRGALSTEQGLRPIEQLIIADRLAPTASIAADRRVRHVCGDISDDALLATLFDNTHDDAGIDSVFALGATLTNEAESDFAHGLKINLQGMVQLIEHCRRQARAPRLVFTSSIAAFGGPLPCIVNDAVPLTPQTSYGTHKAIVELLINDASRQFIDGRSLRLPIVVVRPGPPSESVSDRVASLIREPLRGQATICPLDPATRVPLASVQAVADALIAVHALSAEVFAHTRSMNLPSLSVTIAELNDTIQRIAQWRFWPTPVGSVQIAPDAALQSIVAAWPQRFDSALARKLGIGADASLQALIERFIEQENANLYH